MQKRKDIRNFYIDEDFLLTYEKFKKIMERENVSVSEWIRTAIAEYVRLHEPWNPQQRLDTIMDLGKAYRADQCNMCEAKPMFRCFIGKKSVLLCEDHFEQKRSWFTGWKKL